MEVNSNFQAPAVIIQRKITQHPMDGNLSELQSRLQVCRVEKDLLPLSGVESPTQLPCLAPAAISLLYAEAEDWPMFT
jgi:hypothetical protein